MKILYDHQIFLAQKFGGISRYFNEIMKIQSLSIQTDRIDPDLFTAAQIPSSTGFPSRAQRFVARQLGIVKPVVDVFSIQADEKIESGKYDIFHPTYYNPYFLEKLRKPFVLTVYDMIHEIYKEYFMLSDEDSSNKRLLCSKAQSIIAISHRTKQDLIEIFNIPEEKIFVTHLASDFDKYEPSQPNIELDIRKFILFVGNRGLYKNFYFTIQAISQILLSDEEVQVLCTGHPFSFEEKKFFKELGIDNQILHVYLNNDNELAWAYKNATVFIFPSLYEGFGLPILEAFTSSCPVVTSRGGSLPEVAGDAALYFDPKNVTQIRDAVTTVLYNSVVRNSLIEKGKKRYLDFSWERCRTETELVYKKVK